MSYDVVHTEPDAGQMVDALNATFGRHPHRRASHAKGVFAKGRFVPNAAGRAFSTSRLFNSGALPLTARFSIAGGNPNVSDKAPAARGLSLDVALTDGQHLALVMISTPTFFAATRDSFIAFLDARRPDPATGKPDPERVARSNAAHPDSEAQRRWLAVVAPSESYATAPYFPVHTYLFDRPDGTASPARWVFEPVAGRAGLNADALRDWPDSFLDSELVGRLATAAAEWRVLLQFPEATDPLHNPVAVWPDNRPTLEVARLLIDEIVESVAGDARDQFVFDPVHLPVGISAAGDPIFASRSETYAVSAARRSQ